jgi:hypothetical protein
VQAGPALRRLEHRLVRDLDLGAALRQDAITPSQNSIDRSMSVTLMQ